MDTTTNIQDARVDIKGSTRNGVCWKMKPKCIHIPDESGKPPLQKSSMMMLNCRHLANGSVAKALKDF